ncbi:uncharacterized protein CDV56_106449 [Aspergillus thermomutatus]|uniref:FAD-binding domain-containing protein n=1 Tax=Aspergillus thermomutatus TaxID=41047 RepID=A0A397GRE9_ASPTH|nr:uncharacterized protein CDV56_106449 [Aspergillus thermomutatus]RHZ53582.1 hypothetical protein CDV56_106449 [Aspergillus thermomutatus]
MDITNARSMELLARLGLAQKLREQGVPQQYSLKCLFSTGLSDGGEAIAEWDLPSPEKMWQQIHEKNDGTMPSQAYLRCSQSIFEVWLKPIVEAEPLVECFSGVKFESLNELDDRVESTVTKVDAGVEYIISSQYVIGCDGAGSRVRKSAGIELTGTPISVPTLLVHFKSKDLDVLHRQGQFWHLFLSQDAVVINQDEKDTWTVHIPLTPGADENDLNPEEMVYAALGDAGAPQKFKIDQILVTTHQNIPFGGYGMNTGVGDAYDIGWKLAMALHSQGGEALLDSYEIERRPVALRNVAMSGRNAEVHLKYVTWVRQGTPGLVRSDTLEGRELRERIRAHVLANDGENKSLGIEMGYRHSGSPVVVYDSRPEKEPEWTPQSYHPSTWPGARAPHVFLNDGVTAVYDLLGPDYTLVDFTADGLNAKMFATIAAQLKVPLSTVHLPDDAHVRQIWERDAVLLRPDLHVSWCGDGEQPPETSAIEDILRISTGKRSIT